MGKRGRWCPLGDKTPDGAGPKGQCLHRSPAGEPLLGWSAIEVDLPGLVFSRCFCLLSGCSQAYGAAVAGLSSSGLVPAPLWAECLSTRCRPGSGDGGYL